MIIKILQINIVRVITPQYIECQINPKAKYWKKTGVIIKKINLDRKLREYSRSLLAIMMHFLQR
ncbi:hypothetical protein HMPREF1981_00235 [Bacteroides pyogenes F0041]|uniref:Uncharacterized protein n=1 Tax=Bacteroides pyogenes F0041 TaxID=1321819 RepID=U2CWC3_9BACE|nr:hypothetical protein HMPREF1981_00235 [Bacteroides pyogenes F0041]